MAICETCGEEFKPYWRLADVRTTQCEKCEYLEMESGTKRIWTALAKIVGGFLLILIAPSLNPSLKIFGFLLVGFGTIKLIEDVVMHKRPFQGSLGAKTKKV